MTDSLYGGKTPHLLAIDDDDINLMMISRAFKNEAEVTTMKSGPEGLAWLAENTADLVMLFVKLLSQKGNLRNYTYSHGKEFM